MDDLIRRKDAIDALGEEPLVWDEWTDEYNLGMQTLWVVAKIDIESLPSIDAVPKGRWIGGEIGHCSCCGHYGCASDIWSGCDGDRFCPNCGARMEGEENG